MMGEDGGKGDCPSSPGPESMAGHTGQELALLSKLLLYLDK